MDISFQLEKMTILEKLQTIENIWQNLLTVYHYENSALISPQELRSKDVVT